MGTGYVRQSSADIVNGNDITAGPLNNEFNAIKDAFDGISGHSHDGTAGEGPQIDLTNGVTGALPIFNGGTGGTTIAEAQEFLEVEPKVIAGSTASYWRGDKTFQDFATSVRGAILTGLTTGTNSVINAADTLLNALQKLQAQISALVTTVGTKANQTDVDNALALKAPLASPALTGTPTAPTASQVTNNTQLATTAYVRTAIAAIIQPVAATLSQIWSAATGNLFVSSETINTAQDFVDTSIVNQNSGINFKRLLTANTTYNAPTSGTEKPGKSGTIRIQQDATGGRTVTWNTFWDFGPSGPPTLSTAPNAVDYVFYQIDDGGTRAICTFRKGT